MTDHNREELIRQAALASVKKGARSDAEAVRNYREAARHAEIHLTVFEQAHTPTSAVRERRNVQGEPTDAEVEAFKREWWAAKDEGDDGNKVRRGLRAAAAVREEGQGDAS